MHVMLQLVKSLVRRSLPPPGSGDYLSQNTLQLEYWNSYLTYLTYLSGSQHIWSDIKSASSILSLREGLTGRVRIEVIYVQDTESKQTLKHLLIFPESDSATLPPLRPGRYGGNSSSPFPMKYRLYACLSACTGDIALSSKLVVIARLLHTGKN